MSTYEEVQPRLLERAKAFKHQIVQRTGGRVETLEVELIDDCVVVRGIVPCYYLKQLALQAVLDLIGAASATRIELNVQVLCGVRHPTESH